MPRRRVTTNTSSQLPPFRLTERDQHILETIHAFDGIISLKQIDRLFFSGKGRTQPRARMRKLFAHHYVEMPGRDNIHRVPYGNTVYWLAPKGARLVAGLRGSTLRKFWWRRKPRFSMISHDLAVNDFRIKLSDAMKNTKLMLERWTPESAFRRHPDSVKYGNRKGRLRRRQVRPDGFFAIREKGPSADRLKQYAFLLEIDMGTEDNPRFAREKVRPGIAYLGSRKYLRRFGTRYGRWLVVTVGKRRMRNMKSQTERAGGAGKFYFTTFDEITTDRILKQPIWWRAGDTKPQVLIPPDRR